MKLTPPQREISSSPRRFRVAACGRRFGKSWLAMNELAKFARYPNSKCLYVAPSYRMAKQILWDDLKSLLREKRWTRRINESELSITLVNNSIIMLRSADNPDSIRGIGVDFVVIDEAADIPRLDETWQAVIRPTLSDRQGHALVIGSPKGRNYFYDMWNTVDSNWHSWQFTTLEGGNVPSEEIEAAKRDLDERTFRQEYLAEWVDYSGLIYYNLHDANIVEMPLPQNYNLEIGMDFNVDPGASVLGFRHSGGIHIFDEVEMWGTNTYEMVAEINRRYPQQRKSVYPDAAGSARKSSAAHGITDHIILKNAGYELRVGSVNPAVADRISAVNSAFKAHDGTIRLTIAPKCRKLLDCLRKQTYKEGTRQPEKAGLDHFPDALGYLVNHLLPIRVETQGNHAPIRRATGAYR